MFFSILTGQGQNVQAVKRSTAEIKSLFGDALEQQNDSQDFLTLVTAVATASIEVTPTPWMVA